MKNIFKRSLSFLLAITIIFSSAYVGLGELDFSGLFAVKVKAEGDSISTLNDSGSYTVIGVLQNYVITVVEDSEENWISEITVDGIKYSVSGYLISHDQAKAAENKEIFFTVNDGVVVSFCALDSIDTTPYVALFDSLKLLYKNGKFPDKKIDITGNIVNKLNLTIADNLADSFGHLALTDISVTLTSSNTDIIYFKDGLLSGKNASITFSYADTVAAGRLKSFTQKAYVNTSYNFPKNTQSDRLKISCTVNAKKNNETVSFSDEISVTLTNGDYGSKSTWKTQSLDDLLDQMQSEVNNCTVLTPGEAVEVTTSISAVQISGNFLAIKDDFDMLETIYDMSCYFLGLEYATVGTAGAAFLDVIIDECETASDELKSELRTAMSSLTDSSAFNKFIYWYYNDRQVVLRNKKRINAHCPIDITVTDEDGNTVLSIVDDTVVTSIEGAAGFVCDSRKTLYLPTDIDHNIKITATADGSMDYGIIEYTSSGLERVVSYSDIALTNGEVYTSYITRTETPSADKYNLTIGSGGKIESDETSDFSYAVNSDGTTATITEYKGLSKTVIIPSIIDGYEVVCVGDNAFYDSNELTTVKIPNSVTRIGNYAFQSCDNLSNIIFPDSLTSIGALVLYNTFYYNCLDNWDNGVLYVNSHLIDAEDTIYACAIKTGTKTIADCAFAGCENLTSLTIPDSVQNIGVSAFYACESLEAIVVPDSVMVIGEQAFWRCINLSFITISKNLKEIKNRTFYGCQMLFSISIPKSITYIGEGAMPDNLDFVFYSGSEAQWNNVVVDTNNDSLTRATIHYNSTKHTCNEWYTYEYATCSKDGFREGFCSVCGCIIGEIMPSKGHNYVNGICSVCGNSNVGGDMYECVISNNEVTITKYNGNESEVTIPATLGGYPVVALADMSFAENTFVTSIVMPDTITQIGDHVFAFCVNLKRVSLSSNLKVIDSFAFRKCLSLEEINISETVEIIGYGAFYGCTSLKAITIPDKVSNIGESIFAGCTNLEYITVGKAVSIDFLSSVYECENLKIINITDLKAYFDALNSCDEPVMAELLEVVQLYYDEKPIVSLVVPEGVTNIPCGAFASCEDLQTVTFSDDVREIGMYAFYGCSNLETITLSKNLETIGDLAFYGCTKLKSITIPDKLTNIGEAIFEECESLKVLTVGKGLSVDLLITIYECEFIKIVNVTDLKAYFDALNSYDEPIIMALFGEGKKLYVNGVPVELLVMPEGVTKVPDCAFAFCEKLNSVDINSNITEIGMCAFAYCENLTSVLISDNVNCIGEGAFFNCNKLTTVIIPESVTKISEAAFGYYGSDELKKVKDFTIYGKKGSAAESYANENGFVFVEIGSECEHIVSDWIIDRKATCTENGSMHKECTDCGEVLETVVVFSTGHSFVDGVCSVCDIEIMFEYTVENNSVMVTAYKGVKAYVTIPSVINGLPVTAIGKDAFRDCTEITSVIIPDSVTSIGGSAFRGCINLEELILPDYVTSIPGAMCLGCTNLESVVIPENVVNIGGYAFSGCTSLKTVEIPDSVTNIGGNVFANCNSLIVLSGENSSGHTYALNNSIPFIANNNNTMVDLSNNVIRTNYLNFEIADIMALSQGLTYSLNSNVSGTGVLVDVMKDGTLHSQYTLVVNGDTNGDSICDALDCAKVELASNGNTELSGVYAMAADSNSDDLVDITDYQAIVNKALAS